MAVFDGHVVTNDGRNLIAELMTGQKRILFTRGQLGAGNYNGDRREISALIDPRVELQLIDKRNDEGKLIIRVQITNAGLSTGFQGKEFGIFAKLENGPSDILFSYSKALPDKWDYFPSAGEGQGFIFEIDIILEFDSNENSDIVINGNLFALTAEIASRLFTQMAIVYVGRLSSGRSSLEVDKLYEDDNGYMYKNVGGDRSWVPSTGVADKLLKPATWDNHERDIINLTGRDGYFPIPGGTSIAIGTKWYNVPENKTYVCVIPSTVPTGFPLVDPDSNFVEFDVQSVIKEAIQNVYGLPFGGIIQSNVSKLIGKCYMNILNMRLYECIQNSLDGSINYLDPSFFRDETNKQLSDRLDNLDKIARWDWPGNPPYQTLACFITRIGNICTLTIDSKLRDGVNEVVIPLGYRPRVDYLYFIVYAYNNNIVSEGYMSGSRLFVNPRNAPNGDITSWYRGGATYFTSDPFPIT